MISYTTHETVSHVLTPEGAQIAVQGSHEARVWQALPHKGDGSPMTTKQLEERVGSETAKIGQGRAFKNKWIGKEGDGLVKLVRICLAMENTTRTYLLCLRHRRLKITLRWNCEKSTQLGPSRREKRH